LPATATIVEPPSKPPKGKRSAVGLADSVKLATAAAVTTKLSVALLPVVPAVTGLTETVTCVWHRRPSQDRTGVKGTLAGR
jgi:hypothetical protein